MPNSIDIEDMLDRNDVAPMIMEMLIVIGVQSYRAGLDFVGDLVMQAVEKLEPAMPDSFIPSDMSRSSKWAAAN